ncbi:MAG TPA: MYXO-CTERM sorting domain-containing protein [Polyangiaceae bacterium]|jgi:MYXO-CTERM domain-containing protein
MKSNPVALRAQLICALLLASVPAFAGGRTVADERADSDALSRVLERPFKSLCSASSVPGVKHCLAKVVTNDQGLIVPFAGPQGGLTAQDLQSAYALPTTGGNGRLIAAVDAYDYPNAEADLAAYRSQFGLPPCTSANGCFQKVDENGGTNLPGTDPAGGCDSGWSGEAALDLQMLSAACPDCKIMLVEASAPDGSLATGVDTAVKLGAVAVSNSYGGGEDSSGGDRSQEADYTHAGVLITVSAGDEGFGAEYPATSAGVVAVGGTTLKQSQSTRGWAEAAWKHGGSGCSAEIAKPSWQNDPSCKNRMNADVSAVGDPSTGVAVFCSDPGSAGGWSIVGGTSASAPLIAGAFTVLNVPADPSFAWAHPTLFFDVTTGTNGKCTTPYFCTAATGYDGPTGWGTPNGALLLGQSDLDGGAGDDGGQADASADAGTSHDAGAAPTDDAGTSGEGSGPTTPISTPPVADAGAPNGASSSDGTSGNTFSTNPSSSGCGCRAAGSDESGNTGVAFLAALGAAVLIARKKSRA